MLIKPPCVNHTKEEELAAAEWQKQRITEKGTDAPIMPKMSVPSGNAIMNALEEPSRTKAPFEKLTGVRTTAGIMWYYVDNNQCKSFYIERTPNVNDIKKRLMYWLRELANRCETDAEAEKWSVCAFSMQSHEMKPDTQKALQTIKSLEKDVKFDDTQYYGMTLTEYLNYIKKYIQLSEISHPYKD